MGWKYCLLILFCKSLPACRGRQFQDHKKSCGLIMTTLAQKLVAVLAHLRVEDMTVTKSSCRLAMVKSRSKVGASSKLTSSRWNPNIHLLKIKDEILCTVFSVSATTVPCHLLPSIMWILTHCLLCHIHRAVIEKDFMVCTLCCI